jgi:hypothetical protein
LDDHSGRYLRSGADALSDQASLSRQEHGPAPAKTGHEVTLKL